MNRISLTLFASLSALLVSPAGLWLVPPTTVAQTTAAPLLNTAKLRQVAQSITVKIFANGKSGSGVIIHKQGQVYTVLTNAHVLNPGKPYRIQTPDNKTYTGNIPAQKFKWQGKDLGIIEFSASSDYAVAKLGNASPIAVNQKIVTAGFAYDSKELTFSTGQISLLPDKPLRRGYQLGYTNSIGQGMSGGPLINYQGEVIGVNGLLANTVLSNPYIYADGSAPSVAERQKMRQSSWGIPIQGVGDIIGIGNVAQTPKPPTKTPLAQDTSTPQKSGTVKTVDDIATQVTVLISESGGSNGSGAIVAKKGNTYYALTADHVIATSSNYRLTAPDGKQYPIIYNQIQRLQGIDLALVPFTSQESYRIATLANYKLPTDQGTGKDAPLTSAYAFVSGYPAARKAGEPKKRLFSAGRLTPPEFVRLQLYNPSTVRVASANLQAGGNFQAPDLQIFTDAYELLYSNITFGGMSGGPVFDTQGRIIGVHGRADGEFSLEDGRPLQMGKSLGVPIARFLDAEKQTSVASLVKVETNAPTKLSQAEEQNISKYIVPVDEAPGADAKAVDWLNYGNQLWRADRNAEALEAFERAIQLKPDFYQAWFGKGRVLSKLGKDAEALAAFQKSTQIQPEFASGWKQQGVSLYSLGRLPEALKTIDKAIYLKFSDDFQILLLRGIILSSLQRYPESIEAQSKALKIAPNANIFVLRGYNYVSIAEYQKAIADFTEAIRFNNFNASFYSGRAYAYFFLEDYLKAVADFTTAIRLDPQDATSYSSRGNIYLNILSDYEKAIADYSKVIELNPNNASGYFKRGDAYVASGKKEQATKDYQQALKIQPRTSSNYIDRAYFYAKLRELTKAIADYDRALTVESEPSLRARIYSLRGLVHSAAGDYPKAIADYTELIRLRPNEAGNYLRRAKDFSASGDTQKARADLQKVVSLIKPATANDYQTRGEAYQELGDAQKALTDYTKAISLEPKLVSAYLSRANLYQSLKEERKALNDYTEIIRLQPTGFAYSLRADIYQKLGDNQKAIADYTEAIRLQPNLGLSYTGRGILYQTLGDKQKALIDFTKAVEVEPNNPFARSIRASFYKISGDNQKEIADYTEAIRLKPKYVPFYQSRGDAYSAIKEYQKAIADYTEVIKLQPQSAGAYASRGVGYLALRNYQKALSDYDLAISIDPKLALAYNNRGLVYYEQGYKEKAISQWEKAVALDSKLTEPNMALAVALYAKGDKTRSLKVAETALRLDKQFANVDYLKRNLWGDRLIKDTQTLLQDPIIQRLKLGQSKGDRK